MPLSWIIERLGVPISDLTSPAGLIVEISNFSRCTRKVIFQSTAMLLCDEEPVSDVVIKSDKSEAIEHETTVVLVCSAKGSFLKFTWTNGTKPIVADGDRLTQTDDGLSSTLTIRNVLRSDLVGPIYCTAENTLEKGTSAPFNLTVFCKCCTPLLLFSSVSPPAREPTCFS
ncbi:uncharacterized protein FYW49_018075 [Xenentodon cancila]